MSRDKVRFFTMENREVEDKLYNTTTKEYESLGEDGINGHHYATFEILGDRVFKIENPDNPEDVREFTANELSQYTRRIPTYVGNDEESYNDSLWTPRGTTKEWPMGHIGYINASDVFDIPDTIREWGIFKEVQYETRV